VQVKNYRRMLLLELHSAKATLEYGLVGALRGRRAVLSGTPLADSFPQYAALHAADYLCVEDLDGADADELVAHGLPRTQAQAVMTALGG
jgi:hypothetical protein